jgi:hypothetical protein
MVLIEDIPRSGVQDRDVPLVRNATLGGFQMNLRSKGTLGILTALLFLGPSAPPAVAQTAPRVVLHPPTRVPPGGDALVGQDLASVLRGRRLFVLEKFGGNGRRCESCHDLSTGTTSPEDAQALYAKSESKPGNDQSENLLDPLFRSIDSDDGAGRSYDRLLQNATIRVVINLPPFITNLDDPSARTIVVNRGIPSMINSALLVPVLMQDGRESSLQTQALDAVIAHAEPLRLPSTQDLEDIANFERTLFSRPELADYFHGGPPPELPQGTTDSEIRGRASFVERCSGCHNGPMLNGSPGLHFANIFVSQINRIKNPVYRLRVDNQDGTYDILKTPDPGLALTLTEAPAHQSGIYATANSFRIPTLWNVKATAPYFHDNSAKTLEDVMMHYRNYLGSFTEQEVADIIAYLKVL